MKILLITLCTLVLLISACQKEQLRTAGSPLLQKETMTTYDNKVYTTTYHYNNQDQLIEVRAGSNFYSWISVGEIKYNSQGRLSQTVSYLVNDSNVVIQRESSNSFIYENDRIAKILYTPSYSATTAGRHRSFGYDNLGRVVRDSSFSSIDGMLQEYTVYEYDNNNNVIAIKHFSSSGPSPFSIYTCSYDNNQTPYHFLGAGNSLLLGSRYTFSANNLIRRSRVGDEPQIAKHEYDAERRVIKSIYYPENHPQFTSTFEYFYQ